MQMTFWTTVLAIMLGVVAGNLAVRLIEKLLK
jgi:uncharacterized membrane-anchored protein YhcB (DUF1043 family)